MEPQDQVQITFRSEIHSFVFSVGQEGDCLEERMALKAAVGPQARAQISFKSETPSICFYSESDW